MPRVVTDWISLAEAVELMAASNVRISRSTLSRWAREGRLQAIRPGRRVYVRRAEIRAMLRPPRRGLHAAALQPGLFEDLEG